MTEHQIQAATEAADKLWAWGWYELADDVRHQIRTVAPEPVRTQSDAQNCRDCGANFKPVQRGECSRCGSDGGPS